MYVQKRYVNNQEVVCPSHSIGYYIGLFHGKNCEDITDRDMNETLQVINVMYFIRILPL